jgi:hypothetical protein
MLSHAYSVHAVEECVLGVLLLTGGGGGGGGAQG